MHVIACFSIAVQGWPSHPQVCQGNKVVAAAAQAARAAATPPARQPRPQRTPVAINPSEVLHQSGVTVVKATLGPLMATEARAVDDVVGDFGASDGGI